MNLLIKAARIIDPTSPFNGKSMDILIEKGVIVSVKANIKNEKGYKVVESEDLCVSPGWLDMQARFCDPGFEHREDLISGMKSAANGGFTAVCIMPSTDPPLHTKSQIDYVVNKAKGNIVDVYPVGALTANREGKDIAEMYDMKQSGAVAFSDDKRPVKDAGLLTRALQYASNVDTLIITHNEDVSVSHGGQMHEGETSTRIGLKGIPSLAEELMVNRNLKVLEYTGGKIHFSSISAKGSVELVKRAKSDGLRVTASVAAHNLLLDDTSLSGFDTNFKVNPPLRSKEDIEALKKGLFNGTIDVITSDHTPIDPEGKDLEFDHASNGIIALETAYAAANTACASKLDNEQLISKLAHNPRTILGLPIPSIKEGTQANITLFDPSAEWICNRKNILSKSVNTPFIGYKFRGKVVGVFNHNEYIEVK